MTAKTCQAWDIGYPRECTRSARYGAARIESLEFVVCGRHRGKLLRHGWVVAPLEAFRTLGESGNGLGGGGVTPSAPSASCAGLYATQTPSEAPSRVSVSPDAHRPAQPLP